MPEERRRSLAGSRRWRDRPTQDDTLCKAVLALSLLLIAAALVMGFTL